ncbi:MAG: rhodanese-like domain-containing protein [Planctomycetes bacterium]|nr:rhodanese-like domain-containing protein [Planctomycetota bacterium]
MLKTLLQHSVPEISTKEAYQQKDNALFLDARATEEFQVSHLKGAKIIGYAKINWPVLKGVAKNQPIIVYCSVGYRSEKVAEKLINAGYSKVSNLYGGIFAWINAGHPVYKQDQLTQKVHPYNRRWGKWLNKGEATYKP